MEKQTALIAEGTGKRGRDIDKGIIETYNYAKIVYTNTKEMFI